MADRVPHAALLEHEIGRLLAERGWLTVFFVHGLGAVTPDPLRGLVGADQLAGLAVAPSPETLARLREAYADNPRVQAVHALPATAEGERIAWRRRDQPDAPLRFGAATSDPGLDRLAERITIPCRRLDDLIEEHGVGPIDLLLLADGADLVHSVIDLDLWRPRLVLLPASAAAPTGYRLHTLGDHHLAVRTPVAPGHRATLLRLAADAEAGTARDLLAHLLECEPTDCEALRRLAALEAAAAQPLAALAALGALRRAGEAAGAWAEAATPIATAAIEAFNAARTAGDVATAECLAAGLATLFPDDPGLLEAAFACNRALGKPARVRRFGDALLRLQPDHVAANAVLAEHHAAAGDRPAEARHRARLAFAVTDPLRRLHALHAALSLLLLDPLAPPGWALVAELVAAARAVDPDGFEAPTDRDWGWHYRLLIEAAELLDAAAPPTTTMFADHTGGPLAAEAVAALPGEVVFLVAADAHYLDLYGALFARSVLAACDRPCLIVLHVIGGADRLQALARATGLVDPRVVFAADAFDAAAVTTRCLDSTGPAALPLAHLQSTRFLVAGQMLALLQRPLFVSDIDMLLQRGVADLLVCHADADIVLNRNEDSLAFGSRITANLALFQPTPRTARFLATLARHLEGSLGAPMVTRWVDQCALQVAWQRSAHDTTFGWFDTARDVNNIMYRSWQPNPFRFLSLYHGFDLASLPTALTARSSRPASVAANGADAAPQRGSHDTGTA